MVLYLNSTSCVSTSVGVSGSFNISVDVHQGSALSPLVFNLVIEEAKTKVMITGKECEEPLNSGGYPCGIYGK